MLQEGVIQILHLKDSAMKVPLLGAVGPLQFEVVQYRLETEYGAESRIEASPWSVIRWLPTDFPEKDLPSLALPSEARVAIDSDNNLSILFSNEWSADYFGQTNSGIALSKLPPN